MVYVADEHDHGRRIKVDARRGVLGCARVCFPRAMSLYLCRCVCVCERARARGETTTARKDLARALSCVMHVVAESD